MHRDALSIKRFNGNELELVRAKALHVFQFHIITSYHNKAVGIMTFHYQTLSHLATLVTFQYHFWWLPK